MMMQFTSRRQADSLKGSCLVFALLLSPAVIMTTGARNTLVADIASEDTVGEVTQSYSTGHERMEATRSTLNGDVQSSRRMAARHLSNSNPDSVGVLPLDKDKTINIHLASEFGTLSDAAQPGHVTATAKFVSQEGDGERQRRERGEAPRPPRDM